MQTETRYRAAICRTVFQHWPGLAFTQFWPLLPFRCAPGFPQDTSPAGRASPIKGYAAGADPVIRPGTNGLFYYAGLAFNREENGGSAIFVARFIDSNNQEGSAGSTT